MKFNDNIKVWDEKYFGIIKAWYIVFVIFYLTIQFMYSLGIHDNDTILIEISFFHCPLTWLIWICRDLMNRPHGDSEYIYNYYQDIYRKLYLGKDAPYIFNQHRRLRNLSLYKEFVNGYLTDDSDEILNDIIIRSKQELTLFLFPFVFIPVSVVITLVNIIIKHGIY